MARKMETYLSKTKSKKENRTADDLTKKLDELMKQCTISEYHFPKKK
jgi:hypothetical protein